MHFRGTLSVDTEDWTHFIFPSYPTRQQPAESAVFFRDMVDSCLRLLDEAGVNATFFIVGALAEKYPTVIRKIAAAGHEVGCHGYSHELVGNWTVARFRDDTLRAKSALEEATGQSVKGYRAPAFSLKRSQREQLQTLSDLGFLYDSSIVGPSPNLYEISPNLIEVPPIGIYVGGRGLSTCGGFAFRALPYQLTLIYYDLMKTRYRQGLHFYTHSWEIHPQFPKLIRNPVHRSIQYFNLSTVRAKLVRLLAEVPMGTIGSLVEKWRTATQC